MERAIGERRALAYGLAIAVTVLTIVARLALDPVWGTTKPFMLFFPAVMVVGRMGGFGPGALSTFGSALAIDYFWTEPYGRFHVPEARNVAGFLVFLGSGLLVSALSGSLLRALRGAEELRRARETLLAVVAHDLRGPLSSISMTAFQVRRGKLDDAALARAMERIDRSAARMNRLIRDILDAGRLETGAELTLELGDWAVAPLVREAIEGAQQAASANGVEMTAAVPSDLPPLHCDRERVLQALGNLLANATRFTPRGGRIHVAAAKEESFVRLEVADSGPGVRPADAARVFDRGWSGSGVSTGLGLYIVRGIALAHGGRAWLGGNSGEGARFIVTLPLALPEQAAPAATGWRLTARRATTSASRAARK